jgi:arginase
VAVKITRQPNKIALLGVPTSAAALSAGPEKAPAALRAAGLVERLREVGYEVNDFGDDPVQLFQPDDESPRARNLRRIVAALDALKPRVEAAAKSGALPLILSGDCSIALATVAGLRRYYRAISFIYMDRDADLNVPATSPSGCVDGMVVAHLAGRGAAELVRFWGEPPLVREPDIALFGVDRLDRPEEEFLRHSPIRRFLASDILRKGAVKSAEEAVERTHGSANEFVLHFDVDVISSEDFSATNLPGSGGLRLDDVRQALEVFVQQKHLAAIEVAAYNPERDTDGAGARILVDLLASVLATRRAAFPVSAEPAAASAAAAVSAVAESPASPPAEPTAAPPHSPPPAESPAPPASEPSAVAEPEPPTAAEPPAAESASPVAETSPSPEPAASEPSEETTPDGN